MNNAASGATEPATAATGNGMANLLQDEAALQGLAELVGKLEPLLAGRRLNRLVDLLSVMADTVDMSDAYMVEKVARAVDDGVGAAWTAGNAARMASAQLSQMKDTPTLMGLLRMARQPDVRRGLTFLLALAGVVGRQQAYDGIDHTAD